MKFPTLQDIGGYRGAAGEERLEVLEASDTGRLRRPPTSNLQMVDMQLTGDALRILHFDMKALEAVAGEMAISSRRWPMRARWRRDASSPGGASAVAWLYLVAAILLEVCGTTSMKLWRSSRFPGRPWRSSCFYGASIVCLTLRRTPDRDRRGLRDSGRRSGRRSSRRSGSCGSASPRRSRSWPRWCSLSPAWSGSSSPRERRCPIRRRRPAAASDAGG